MDRPAFRLFAGILDYPERGLLEAVHVCEETLAEEHSEAAALLGAFRAYAEAQPLGKLQEQYTAAFDLDTLSDLDATCYPYVGHHLFGESHKRSAFLVGLLKRFRAHGFSVERELPDHLVVLLRFAAACPDDELVAELVHEALVPALERMAGEADEPAEPRSGKEAYRLVLRALGLVLEAQPQPIALVEHAQGAV